jgi:ABC-type polysaccharide/polyol phosphate transport system ATPase subunit
MVMPAISLHGAGKRFVKYEDAPMLISRALALRARTRRSHLWAMRGASFDVADGECIGIVGRNGSGKSTLLQLLAGVTAPTEGSVAVRGRVAPLISVGVGFHLELTGRENVYVNGMILGLSRDEIEERFEEIVEFAEVRPFIDTPVKFYSSGMFVRLGFAVAVTADPDVLLIDEVLAVGDLAFQIKCFNRMMEIKERGTTIVVVSHNLNAIRRMCPRSLVVHDAEIRYDGPTDEALSRYHELLGAHSNVEVASLDGQQADGRPAAHFEDFSLLRADGQPTGHVDGRELVTFRATVRFERRVANPLVNFNIISESGVLVYSTPRTMDGGCFEPGQTASIEVAMRLALSYGSYSAGMGMVSADRVETLAQSPRALLFYVSGRPEANGLVDLDAEVTMTEESLARPFGARTRHRSSGLPTR